MNRLSQDHQSRGPRSGKILVVEDQEEQREALAFLLESDGYQVVTAEGGDEALGLLARHQFCAMLTDLSMPGMSGTELTHEVRMRSSVADIPIILMSASFGKRTPSIEEVDGCLSKPFTLQALVDLLVEIGCSPATSQSPH